MDNRRVVMLVEDDRPLRQMYATALEAAGLSVVRVSNGARALQLIEEQPPSLIVLDLNLPGIDGWEVQRDLAVRADTCDIPIIVLSAEADFGAAVPQVSAFIRKPCCIDHLVTTVEERLARAA